MIKVSESKVLEIQVNEDEIKIDTEELVKYIPQNVLNKASEEKLKSWLLDIVTFKNRLNRTGFPTYNYDCKKCKNTKHIPHLEFCIGSEEFNEYVTICSCNEIREAKRLAIKSGLGELLEKNLDSIVADNQFRKNLKSIVESYLKSNHSSWFTCLGQTGSGKTLACSIIANNFLKNGIEARYMIWGIWIKELKRLTLDESFNEYFGIFEKVPVLYIDDFLKGKYTETDINYAFDLLNSRYNQNLITIISSERTLDELINIDEAIAGRIKQKSKEYLLQISKDTSKNYRFNEEKKKEL